MWVKTGRFRWAVQRAICLIGGAFFRVVFRLRSVGNPPASGAYFIAPNHTSYMDPMLIQMLVPRHVTFMMDASIFRVRMMNWFFRFWGAIPVSTTGRSAAGAMKHALQAARGGDPVGVFPEGRISRSGDLQDGRAGVAVLMQRAHVPVVPVAIMGAFEVLPRHARFPRLGRITVIWGDPILVNEAEVEGNGRAAANALKDQVMASIKDLQDRHRTP